jgi:CubicO group peptidase (beta-lactamase class C family)
MPPLPTSREASDEFRSIRGLVRRLMRQGGVPGAAVGVWHDGKEEVEAFGVTDEGAAATASSRFQIGSITKTYTATLALVLADEGLVDLDEPVRTYLPDLRLRDPAAAEVVSLRHLLTHSAGFDGDELFGDLGDGDDALARYVEQLHRLAPIAPPGALYGYCNAGFCLAGHVLEVVADAGFEQLVRGRILEPLELRESGFEPAAVGRARAPAGGLACSVRDLLRWARFHLGDRPAAGRRVLPAEALRSMQEPALPAGVDQWAGLAWRLTSVDGLRVVGHGGGTPAHRAELWIVPERDFACALLLNRRDDDIDSLADGIGRGAVARYLGVSAEPVAPIPIELSEAQLAGYTGRYETGLIAVDLVADSGGLLEHESDGHDVPGELAQSPALPPRRLVFYDTDRVFVAGDALTRTEFVRDNAGRVRWYRHFHRALPKRASRSGRAG